MTNTATINFPLGMRFMAGTTGRPEFARRFMAATQGQSQTEIALRLRYTASRIGQVQRGERPSREFVERFVEEYGQPREEWLELAGYGPQPPTPDPRAELEDMVSRGVEQAIQRTSGAALLMAGIAALARELGRPIRVNFDESTKAHLSVAEAEALLADIRQQAESESTS